MAIQIKYVFLAVKCVNYSNNNPFAIKTYTLDCGLSESYSIIPIMEIKRSISEQGFIMNVVREHVSNENGDVKKKTQLIDLCKSEILKHLLPRPCYIFENC